MTVEFGRPIGFIGLGTMGRPIALNLVRSGVPLVVWNRTKEKADELVADGAEVAGDPASLFERSGTVVLMLASGHAIDAVLERGTKLFDKLVAGHLVVNMGTTSPSYSRDLCRDLRAAGARYVEAPVSGQKVRAENRQLIGLLAGDPGDLDEARKLISPVCSDVLPVGRVPAATDAKFALSVYQATSMAALAEAVNYAKRSDVDLAAFSKLLRTGPLFNALMDVQLRKLVEDDFSVEASVARVLEVIGRVLDEGGKNGVSLPLLSRSAELYAEAFASGNAELDATSVVRVFERASGRPHDVEGRI